MKGFAQGHSALVTRPTTTSASRLRAQSSLCRPEPHISPCLLQQPCPECRLLACQPSVVRRAGLSSLPPCPPARPSRPPSLPLSPRNCFHLAPNGKAAPRLPPTGQQRPLATRGEGEGPYRSELRVLGRRGCSQGPGSGIPRSLPGRSTFASRSSLTPVLGPRAFSKSSSQSPGVSFPLAPPTGAPPTAAPLPPQRWFRSGGGRPGGKGQQERSGGQRGHALGTWGPLAEASGREASRAVTAAEAEGPGSSVQVSLGPACFLWSWVVDSERAELCNDASFYFVSL